MRLLWFLTCVAAVNPVVADETDRTARILWTVDWSPDGKRFAVGGEQNLWIYDAHTQRVRRSLSDRVKSVVHKVRWHPDGNQLAISGDNQLGATGIYTMRSDQFKTLMARRGTRGVDWHPNGRVLATAGNEGRVKIWKPDGTLLHDIPRYKDALGLTGVSWQPGGKRLVSIGKYITLHNADGTIVKQIVHRPTAVGFCLLLCVEWHPSGAYFVVGDYGNTETNEPPVIQFWTADGVMKKEIPVHDGAEFREVRWSPDGHRLASASDALCIWSADGTLLHTGSSNDNLWGVAWSPTGDQILSSSEVGRIHLWTDSAVQINEIKVPEQKAALE